MSDKYNISPGAIVGACGDNATASGGEYNQTVNNYPDRTEVKTNVKTPATKGEGKTINISGQHGAVGPNSKSHGNVYNKYVNGELVSSETD
jgi:hypothetical protein